MSFLYTVRCLLVKSKRRADTRRRRDSLDSFSVCDYAPFRVQSRLTHLTQARANASRSSGGAFVWIDGPLGRAASKVAHRLGTRTSPKVARLEMITEAGSNAADHRLGDGWRTPPARQVDARAFLAYAGPMANGRELQGHRSPTLAPPKGR